ncbi:MAG: hypothetical protein HS130_06495 [Deltaproteobacteria bacterium]|nr:hypothetical protein [Deltaproteobacteria bacterium]
MTAIRLVSVVVIFIIMAVVANDAYCCRARGQVRGHEGWVRRRAYNPPRIGESLAIAALAAPYVGRPHPSPPPLFHGPNSGGAPVFIIKPATFWLDAAAA